MAWENVSRQNHRPKHHSEWTFILYFPSSDPPKWPFLLNTLDILDSTASSLINHLQIIRNSMPSKEQHNSLTVCFYNNFVSAWAVLHPFVIANPCKRSLSIRAFFFYLTKVFGNTLASTTCGILAQTFSLNRTKNIICRSLAVC